MVLQPLHLWLELSPERMAGGDPAALNCTRLDEQTRRRHDQCPAARSTCSAEIPGITPQKLDPALTRNGHYAYIFHYDQARLAGVQTERFIEAMNAEGIPNQAAYPPVHALDVFQNGAYSKRLCAEQASEDHAFLRGAFPVTERGCLGILLGAAVRPVGRCDDMHEIAAAVQKIQRFAKELRSG